MATACQISAGSVRYDQQHFTPGSLLSRRLFQVGEDAVKYICQRCRVVVSEEELNAKNLLPICSCGEDMQEVREVAK